MCSTFLPLDGAAVPATSRIAPGQHGSIVENRSKCLLRRSDAQHIPHLRTGRRCHLRPSLTCPRSQHLRRRARIKCPPRCSNVLHVPQLPWAALSSLPQAGHNRSIANIAANAPMVTGCAAQSPAASGRRYYHRHCRPCPGHYRSTATQRNKRATRCRDVLLILSGLWMVLLSPPSSRQPRTESPTDPRPNNATNA